MMDPIQKNTVETSSVMKETKLDTAKNSVEESSAMKAAKETAAVAVAKGLSRFEIQQKSRRSALNAGCSQSLAMQLSLKAVAWAIKLNHVVERAAMNTAVQVAASGSSRDVIYSSTFDTAKESGAYTTEMARIITNVVVEGVMRRIKSIKTPSPIHKKEAESATKIQCVARGHLQRQQIEKIKKLRKMSMKHTKDVIEAAHDFKHRWDFCFVFKIPQSKLDEKERQRQLKLWSKQEKQNRLHRKDKKPKRPRRRNSMHIPINVHLHHKHRFTWRRLYSNMLPHSSIKPLSIILEKEYFRLFWIEMRGSEDYVADNRDFHILRALFISKLINEFCGLDTLIHWGCNRKQIFIIVRSDEQDLLAAATAEGYKLQFDKSIDVDNDAHKGCHAYVSYDQRPEIFSLYQRYSTVLQVLANSWCSWNAAKSSRVPLGKIRNYFGEQIAFYFAFLMYYTNSLWIPSLVGTCIFIWQMLERFAFDPGNYRGIPTCVFSVFIAIWSPLMLAFWKQKQQSLATRWGTADFQSREVDRPQFWGDLVESSSLGTIREGQWQGKHTLHYSSRRRRRTLVMSACLVMTMLGCVVATVATIMIFRTYLMSLEKFRMTGAAIAGVLNFIQIQIFNVIYTWLATKLTEMENWQTNTAYNNHLADKLMLFRCINNFNSFFYLAIFKRFDTGCYGACKSIQWGLSWDESECPLLKSEMKNIYPGDSYDKNKNNWPSGRHFSSEFEEYEGDCEQEVMFQLGIIFLSSITILNTIELLLPWIDRYLALREETSSSVPIDGATRDVNDQENNTLKETKTVENMHNETLKVKSITFSKPVELSIVEEESALDPYDLGEDYSEVVIQYGYVTLFVAAFPLTPLLARLSTVVEQYIDSNKLCYLIARPIPEGAQDIGAFYNYMVIVTKTAIITNGTLFAFTTPIFTTNEQRFIAFIAFVFVVHLIQCLVSYSIEDVPGWLESVRKRHKSLSDSLMFGIDILEEKPQHLISSDFDPKIHDIHNLSKDSEHLDYSNFFRSSRKQAQFIPHDVLGDGLPSGHHDTLKMLMREKSSISLETNKANRNNLQSYTDKKDTDVNTLVTTDKKGTDVNTLVTEDEQQETKAAKPNQKKPHMSVKISKVSRASTVPTFRVK